jgi:threonine dehydratase
MGSTARHVNQGDADALLALRSAAELVYRSMSPTLFRAWPLLEEATGVHCWVKHENHSPVGAFKIRGGLVYMARLLQREPEIRGLVSATRGNHGQSLAFAAAQHGLRSVIVVPRGNALEKNAAMRSLGADLIEFGNDFDEAREYAAQLAAREGLHFVASFHADLVDGVASYALEMFEAKPDLDAIFVPIGLGSGICGVIKARNALGLSTKIYGVVSEGANAYAQSFRAGRVIQTDKAITMADGIATRVPQANALDMMLTSLADIVEVSDAEIEEAIRLYLRATHNLAEGAGAAPLAALLKHSDWFKGRSVGLVLCGGNLDTAVLARVLADSLGR